MKKKASTEIPQFARKTSKVFSAKLSDPKNRTLHGGDLYALDAMERLLYLAGNDTGRGSGLIECPSVR